MRTPDQVRERITMLLVEEINRVGFKKMEEEPENTVPKFIEDLASELTELVLDEISFGRKR